MAQTTPVADFVRVLGLVTAAGAIGLLIALAIARPGSTGFRVPWRYWGVAAGLIIESTGIYARFSLFGTPLSWRDLSFLAINLCIGVAVAGTLWQGPYEKGGGETK